MKTHHEERPDKAARRAHLADGQSSSEKPALYPDGVPVRLGDIVWFDEGGMVGRVVGIHSSRHMCEEIDADWEGGYALFLNCGLGGQDWGLNICIPEEVWEDEGIEKLTMTEQLTLQLLLHLLGRQLGLPLRNNPEWLCEAYLKPMPLATGADSADEWVWHLRIAHRDAPEKEETYRFNRGSMRFCPVAEAWETTPAKPPLFADFWGAPSPPRAPRSFIHKSGVRYTEGDWVWVEAGCPAVRVERMEQIFLPDDPDYEWLVDEPEKWWDDGQPAPVIGMACAVLISQDFTDDEWYKKLSAAEQLAVELLDHLLRQQPEAHMEGCVGSMGITLEPASGEEKDVNTPWYHRWSQWELGLTFRDWEHGVVQCWRHFRFNRETCDFTLLAEEKCPEV